MYMGQEGKSVSGMRGGEVYLGSKGKTVSVVRRGTCTVWWECIVTQGSPLDLLQRN